MRTVSEPDNQATPHLHRKARSLTAMFGYSRAGLIFIGLKDRLPPDIVNLKGSLVVLSIIFVALTFGLTKALYFGQESVALPAIASVILVLIYFLITEIWVDAPKTAGWLLIVLPVTVLIYEILLLFYTNLAWGCLGDPNIGKILMTFAVYNLLIILAAVRHLNRSIKI